MAGGMFPPIHAGAMFRNMLGYAGYAGSADASYSSVEQCEADKIAAANNSTGVAAEHPDPAPADDAATADDAEHASSQHDAGQYVDVERLLQNKPAAAADQFSPAPASKKHRPQARKPHLFKVCLYKIVIESCVCF